MMDKNWQGIDFLRGLGIFMLLVMHSAFYYFGGLWDLDFDNPPLIITVIGFLLMFAGLFGLISGTVHGISIIRLRRRQTWTLGQIVRKKAVSAFFILIVAWLYFTLTGPGLADFAKRVMNNSILVELIRNGRWVGPNLERLLYVDSLVMIGSNTLLVSLIMVLLIRVRRLTPSALLGLAGAVMLLSLLRLPLYPAYLEQVEQGHWLRVLLLFWLVNKNNPVLPFLAFGLLGAWLGLLLEENRSRKPAFWLGIALFATGMLCYVLLPDTMLQRAIDLKWYSIMLAQMGLFLLLVLGAVGLFDRTGKPAPAGFLFRFFSRFSYAGLTAFFWESIVSALVWRLLVLVFPALALDIGGALLFGFALAIGWGFLLLFWSRIHYVGSIEYAYGLLIAKIGRTSGKADKLRSGL